MEEKLKVEVGKVFEVKADSVDAVVAVVVFADDGVELLLRKEVDFSKNGDVVVVVVEVLKVVGALEEANKG